MMRPVSSVLNVEVKYYRETLLHTYWSTQYHNQDKRSMNYFT